jgi:hypothetical protein
MPPALKEQRRDYRYHYYKYSHIYRTKADGHCHILSLNGKNSCLSIKNKLFNRVREAHFFDKSLSLR